ncbi:hypothetical protein B0H14DRAFT_3163677 [Mycena olivaceomarginata]|nr:hypothetical protein B0H14DRAFT_3163677 [Mycena olivaceomarginata]
MSLPALDTVTGLLVKFGSQTPFNRDLGELLYTFEITQSLYYFQNFKQDDWKNSLIFLGPSLLQTLVTLALLVDTLSIVADYICVYLYTVTHADDIEYLYNGHWPTPLYGFTTGFLAALVQAFLVFRYWHFTQNTLVSLFLSFAILVSFGSVFTCNLMLILYTSLADRPKLKIPVALWLVIDLVVDAGIASVLLWEFRKARGILKETQSVLDRLTAVTIQSGAAAATLAGGALIAYFINPETNIPGGILFLLGRVYVITLLSNLNIRKSAKSFSTTGTSSGPGTIGGEPGPLTLTRWTSDDPCGIRQRLILIPGWTIPGCSSVKHQRPVRAVNRRNRPLRRASRMPYHSSNRTSCGLQLALKPPPGHPSLSLESTSGSEFLLKPLSHHQAPARHGIDITLRVHSPEIALKIIRQSMGWPW